MDNLGMDHLSSILAATRPINLAIEQLLAFDLRSVVIYPGITILSSQQSPICNIESGGGARIRKGNRRPFVLWRPRKERRIVCACVYTAEGALTPSQFGP